MTDVPASITGCLLNPNKENEKVDWEKNCHIPSMLGTTAPKENNAHTRENDMGPTNKQRKT